MSSGSRAVSRKFDEGIWPEKKRIGRGTRAEARRGTYSMRMQEERGHRKIIVSIEADFDNLLDAMRAMK